jgi:hypothetical protein
MERTDPLPTKPAVLQEFANRFIDWVNDGRLEEKTRKFYRNGWRLLTSTSVAMSKVDQITGDCAEQLKFPGSAANANCALRTLRRMLHKAEEWKVIGHAPNIKMMKEQTNFAVTATGSFVPTGNMQLDRDPFAATLLPDGRVLIAGGYFSGGITNTTELYDSAGIASSPGAMMLSPHADHTATLLNNGKVLIVGGYSPSVSGSAEIYDGTSFSNAGSLTTARAQHTATLLIAGGATDFNPTPTATAELYNPATRSFSVVNSMSSPRAFHTATLLNDGTVLLAISLKTCRGEDE